MCALRTIACSAALLALIAASGSANAAKPIFESKTISAATPGNSVEMSVELKDAKKLYLVVTDAGDGFGCDWAGWANPRLIGPGGERKLTELKWKSATAGYGEVRLNANCRGERMSLAGAVVENGIGTHAHSVIEYDLPEGYTQFKSLGFLDDAGTRQGCGSTVRFLVFTERPDARYLASSGPVAVDRSPENAVGALDVADGLEVTLFASEPMMVSPSNIDVDHRGRVWVCEIVNYRHFRNTNNPVREAGDRILILEDTTGDGIADSRKVFYQGRDIDSAHGVCVLGNKVIVSAGDSVMVLTDTNGDDKADRKEILFSKIAGTQHDHGIHSALFGPDGKLYFNFGNSGKHLHDAEGNPIVDKAGNVVNDRRQPYQEGMVFRCNLDGTEVETLAWNFRNNWELAVDSFGGIWQSDNDDDGNRAVRINFVMEYGNYGYRQELTGAGWREPRTGMHEEIPFRHFHQNDPGVVPNLLHTGAGSPTGIIVYEGDLLPRKYLGHLIHCDAGPNIVRAYLIENQGAGYTAEISDLLHGARDNWFRPSDVCVAPDGSLIVADWYDPGVGGHAQGEINRGRLFRVAPPDTPYKAPRFDFESVEGAIAALGNPNLEVRYLAWTSLHRQGNRAAAVLKNVFETSDNPRLRARAMWVLGKLEGHGPAIVQAALADADPNIRMAGLRLGRQLDLNRDELVARLIDDPSSQVIRECAIALAESRSDRVPELWVKLADRIDVTDRWALEAVGIAARGRWDACLDAYLANNRDILTEQSGFLIWRSRGSQTPGLLAKLIRNPLVEMEHVPYLFRSFDFQNTPDKQEHLTALAFGPTERTPAEQSYIMGEALKRIERIDFARHPEYKRMLDQVLDAQAGSMPALALINRFELTERYPELLALAQAKPATQEGVAAASLLIDKQQWKLFTAAIRSQDENVAAATLEVLGNTGKGGLLGLLMPFVTDDQLDPQRRRLAVRALGRARNGALRLVELARMKQLDAVVAPAVAAALHTAEWQDVKEHARQLFPTTESKDNKPLPPISELVKFSGNPEQGKVLFNTTATCNKCHRVNEIGKQVGPDLDEIGSKLSRQALLESILFPSAGISHNYENYLILTDEGTTVSGVMVSETPEAVTLKGADAIPRTVNKANIDEMIQQKISLMPADLHKLMTQQELLDVVSYMESLKKK
jgi:putative membrane-bound dehydrogenase-like protein